MEIQKKRIIVGISGASGAILGIRILEILKRDPEWETHLIMSAGAELTITDETDYAIEDVIRLSDHHYSMKDIGASLASGTFKTEGMIIVPCSMKTAAGIAGGYSDSLLLRAADVTIKEGRKLVVAPRENPLSRIHLRNLLTLAESGVMIMPPMATYYGRPENLEAMNLQIVGKILDQFNIVTPGFRRWKD